MSTQTALDLLTLLQQDRIKQCEHNFRRFCFTYFRHHFVENPSIMHEELFEDIQEAIDNNLPDLLTRAAPRGNAKSTLASLALPIWCAVYKKKNYILLVSDTADQADDFLQNVKNEFEDNELLLEDFGDLQGIIWTGSNIVTSTGIRLQALGAGKKVRGRKWRQHRPDLIVCDDLENDENIQSADQRKKNESWYYRALAQSGDKTTDIFVVGTILHYDSLLTKLLKNPIYNTKTYKSVIKWSPSAKWDEWERIIVNLEDPDHIKNAEAFFEANKEEMLADTKVLWEEKENYYTLMVQRISAGPAAFASEKQNEPLSDDERRFLESWIQYYEESDLAGLKLQTVGFVDPSMGKMGGDFSAIITLGVDPNGLVYVLSADMAKRHPDIIINDLISQYETYHHTVVGVEINQFQEYFRDSLSKKLQEVGISIPIRGIRQHSDKMLRIQSLQPDIKNGRVKFRRDQRELIEQLVNFPSAAHDDGPDALEGALGLVAKRSALLDYYEEQANNANNSTQSFLRNPNLQRLG